jgi:hypothetical protein
MEGTVDRPYARVIGRSDERSANPRADANAWITRRV